MIYLLETYYRAIDIHYAKINGMIYTLGRETCRFREPFRETFRSPISYLISFYFRTFVHSVLYTEN